MVVKSKMGVDILAVPIPCQEPVKCFAIYLISQVLVSLPVLWKRGHPLEVPVKHKIPCHGRFSTAC